jgi:hypothetical protein
MHWSAPWFLLPHILVKGLKMDRTVASIIVLPLCVVLSARARGEAQSTLAGNGSGDAVAINMRSVNVNERRLLLRYEIRNSSPTDIWVCTTIDDEFGDAEVYAQEDNQVLLVRRRLDVPTNAFFTAPPDGRYVRLRPRQSRANPCCCQYRCIAIPFSRMVPQPQVSCFHRRSFSKSATTPEICRE